MALKANCNWVTNGFLVEFRRIAQEAIHAYTIDRIENRGKSSSTGKSLLVLYAK